MMVSTKGRYAIRVMIDLAQNSEEGYISLNTISKRQEISLKYLESIVAVLNKAGIVESIRGKDGGYRLTKKPEDYTVGEIIKLTEGTIAPVTCLESPTNSCENADQCLTLPIWIKLEKIVEEYLDGISLRDLLDRKI